MITPSQHDPLAQRWRRLEDAVEGLHVLARQAAAASEFYQPLLAEASQILHADDLAVWARTEQGDFTVAAEQGEPLVLPPGLEQQVVDTLQPAVGVIDDRQILIYPVKDVALDAESTPAAAALIGVASEAVDREDLAADRDDGRRQLLATLAEVAADFHVFERLRRQEQGHGLTGQVNTILRRICQAPDVDRATRILANEGRLAIGCDRLSVLLQRGRRWQLMATSGVDRVERQTDFRRDAEALAAATATWGEPLELGDAVSPIEADLPPTLTDAAMQHFDHSHARRLCCVPFRLADRGDRPHRSPGMVLLAEDFTDQRRKGLRRPLVELGEGCIPALVQTVRFNALPARWALWWSDRWVTKQWATGWATGAALGLAATLLVIAALTMVGTTYEIEAPATLQPVDRQHVFATTTGTVREVRVRHGDLVKAGDILAVLDDPTLAIERQTVAGELATVRERLSAIAATRTDRSKRQTAQETRLPLSAEAQQLAEREASLLAQRELLDQRSESLVLRSPQQGQVLTLDVQSLLETRPVERGQQLFTIADVDGRWELLAELEQRDLHTVLAAQETAIGCPVRYRLTGELGRDYRGVLEQVAATAVLDADRLTQGPGPVEATIRTAGGISPAARPGMSATVKIDCGEYSLGYVWFHEAWETIYRWFTF